ncbi:MAG: TadE/TadG family type IV pilus assembly protein [Streptosporangiaceae bacterium]
MAGRADGGAFTLSYVIIVPVFLAGLMVIVQASVWYLARQAALAAARQGADAARVLDAAPGAGPQTAVSFARSAASGYLLSPAASSAGSTAGTVEVTVTGTVPSLVPGLRLTVRQSAALPVERFTTPGG